MSKTLLAKKLEIYEAKARYDAAAKQLLADRQVLSRIMKWCITEYADCSLSQIMDCIEGDVMVGKVAVDPDETGPSIVGARTEDTLLYEGTVQYDVLLYARSPQQYAAGYIVDIEAQKDETSAYPVIKRSVYYSGRMISSQNGTIFTNAEYAKIRKVYSIWICVKPKAQKRKAVAEYSLAENVRYGHIQEEKEHYDLITVIMLYLGKGEDGEGDKGKAVSRKADKSNGGERGETAAEHGEEDYTNEAPDTSDVIPQTNVNEKVLGMLETLFVSKLPTEERKRKLEKEYGMVMTEELEKGAETMCNLSDGIWEEGREEGIEEGRKEGHVCGQYEILSAVMNMNGWTMEETMNRLGLSEEKKQKIYEWQTVLQ